MTSATAVLQLAAKNATTRLPWRLIVLPVTPLRNETPPAALLLPAVWEPACARMSTEDVAGLSTAACHPAVVTLGATICRTPDIAALDETAQAAWLIAEIHELEAAVTADENAASDAAASVHPGADWREQLAAAKRRNRQH